MLIRDTAHSNWCFKVQLAIIATDCAITSFHTEKANNVSYLTTIIKICMATKRSVTHTDIIYMYRRMLVANWACASRQANRGRKYWWHHNMLRLETAAVTNYLHVKSTQNQTRIYKHFIVCVGWRWTSERGKPDRVGSNNIVANSLSYSVVIKCKLQSV